MTGKSLFWTYLFRPSCNIHIVMQSRRIGLEAFNMKIFAWTIDVSSVFEVESIIHITCSDGYYFHSLYFSLSPFLSYINSLTLFLSLSLIHSLPFIPLPSPFLPLVLPLQYLLYPYYMWFMGKCVEYNIHNMKKTKINKHNMNARMPHWDWGGGVRVCVCVRRCDMVCVRRETHQNQRYTIFKLTLNKTTRNTLKNWIWMLRDHP